MKIRKLAALAVSALLLLAAFAVMADGAVSAGLPNPMVEYDSLAAINEVCGTNLIEPGVMGVTNETFYAIDGTVASYSFELNGSEWCFRAAQTDETDISGLYKADGAFFAGYPEGEYDYETYGGWKASRWFEGACQYTLAVNDNGVMDEETFRGITEEMKQMTVPSYGEELYGSFRGAWQDTVSGRAWLDIVPEGSTLRITVVWSNSAFDSYRWEMTGTLTDDAKVVYSDCREVHEEYDEKGALTETVVSENGAGWFIFNPVLDTLAWEGAADENCRTCVFTADHMLK